MPGWEIFSEFVAWCQNHITGDEKGQAQIFPDRGFQAIGLAAGLPSQRSPEIVTREVCPLTSAL